MNQYANIRKNISYSQREYPDDNVISVNAYGIERITEDKFLTLMILSKNAIPTPKFQRITLNRAGQDLLEKIYFPHLKDDSRDTKNFFPFVIKEREGCGGEKVALIRQFQDIWNLINFFWKKCVIEDLIESYPIYINGVKKDWNLRVLVSYDIETKRYITVGITGRIDTIGWPVNRSISAENISFEELWKLCGWSEIEFSEAKQKVEKIAELSSEILVQVGNRKWFEPHINNIQTVFWVDIIIDSNKNPFVIEVNDSSSGCIFELAQLEGITSVYPIARAIVHKVLFQKSVQELHNTLKKTAEETGICVDFLIELFQEWKLIVWETEEGFYIEVPEVYLKKFEKWEKTL